MLSTGDSTRLQGIVSKTMLTQMAMVNFGRTQNQPKVKNLGNGLGGMSVCQGSGEGVVIEGRESNHKTLCTCTVWLCCPGWHLTSGFK